MGYDSWITGIYNNYDGRFKFHESQDNIYQLQDIIIKHLGRQYLWDENGDYKIKLQNEYAGLKRSLTTDNDKRG